MKSIKYSIDKNSSTAFYLQVADHITGLINRNYFKNQQVFSINQIISHYNVGRETAKKALEELQKRQIITKVQGKGCLINDHEKTDADNWVILFPFFAEFFIKVTDSFKREAAQQAVTTQVSLEMYGNKSNELLTLIKTYQSKFYKPRFFIILPTTEVEQAIKDIENIADPSNTIIIDTCLYPSSLSSVIQNHQQGTELAADHLLSKTCGNLAFLYDEYQSRESELLEKMKQIFLNKVNATGRECVVFYSHKQVTPEILKKKKIDAVFCLDDIEAMLLIGNLRKYGISTPDDVKVLGYNNNPIGEFFTPAISTIDGQHELLAEKAVSIINKKSTQIVVDARLVIRESS